MKEKLKQICELLKLDFPQHRFLARLEGESGDELFIHAENNQRGWSFKVPICRDGLDPELITKFLSRYLKRLIEKNENPS